MGDEDNRHETSVGTRFAQAATLAQSAHLSGAVLVKIIVLQLKITFSSNGCIAETFLIPDVTCT